MERFAGPPTVALLLLVAGCAGTAEKDSVMVKNDAIDDYIKVAELKEIDEIRKRNELHHKKITRQYVILSDRKRSYLAVFRRQCRGFDEGTTVTPDVRYDTTTVRARFDTYRGCRILSLFEVTDGQAEELLALGESPGK